MAPTAPDFPIRRYVDEGADLPALSVAEDQEFAPHLVEYEKWNAQLEQEAINAIGNAQSHRGFNVGCSMLAWNGRESPRQQPVSSPLTLLSNLRTRRHRLIQCGINPIRG